MNSDFHLVIIIPALNEKEATETIIQQIGALKAERQERISLLYVDGNSTDGTLELLQERSAEYDWLHYLEQSREERGLGAAYRQGMMHAISALKADFLLEFDGDLQHRTEDIPQFLDAASDHDYVVGSRFIPGGSIPDDWGADRVFLSKGGNLIARLMLGAPHLHDVTSGFKLSRVSGFLDQFDFSSLYSLRHAYKIHLFAYMLSKKARVLEVPITFQPREAGESKLIKNDILDTLRVLFLIRTKGA